MGKNKCSFRVFWKAVFLAIVLVVWGEITSRIAEEKTFFQGNVTRARQHRFSENSRSIAMRRCDASKNNLALSVKEIKIPRSLLLIRTPGYQDPYPAPEPEQSHFQRGMQRMPPDSCSGSFVRRISDCTFSLKVTENSLSPAYSRSSGESVYETLMADSISSGCLITKSTSPAPFR